MFGSLIGSFAGDLTGFRGKLILYVIVGITALVIINLLLDGIRKSIRGLDTAVLGALFIWLGTEAKKYALVKSLSDLLFLSGGTLVVVGLLVFIIIKMIRSKRKAKQYNAKHQETEKEKEKEAGGEQ